MIGGIPPVLKQYAVFIDGVGYFGMADEAEPPPIKEKTEKWSAGGLAGEVNVPMKQLEPLECKITFGSYNAGLLSLWGASPIDAFPLILRGGQQDSTSKVQKIEIGLTGAFRNIEWDKWQVGKLCKVPLTYHATAFKLTMDGIKVLDLDIEAMVWEVGGKDLYAEMRRAIGR